MSTKRIESQRSGPTLTRIGNLGPSQRTETGLAVAQAPTRELIAPQLGQLPFYPEGQRISPSRSIAEFVTPRLSDPSLLQPSRLIPILQHLINTVLPSFTGEENLPALASPIIADEIARHRDLMTRVHGGIAA
ncbi:MAG: hypothetical protein FWD68_13380 [Alphaproteobacteria bacterium]|nr:hypothetical protein [Alphaproteobacteria bacterium]